MEFHSLKTVGLDDEWQRQFQPFADQGYALGRVAIQERNQYKVYSSIGLIDAQVTGKYLYTAETQADLPQVGDWVVMMLFEDEAKGVISECLPRRSKISRKAAGQRTDEQIIAANIDTIFIVTSADDNFNLRRLERYLLMVTSGKAEPVIVLNKTDLAESVESLIQEVRSIFPGPVVPASALQKDGVEALRALIQAGKTFAFVGSSGVGKSSLINSLFGQELFLTQDIRRGDGKGRHTTTRRHMVILPEGGILVDTPGMRELQPWEGQFGTAETFSDFHHLARQCRFTDCSHRTEIGCAILEALETKSIEQDRYDSYMRLLKEQAFLENRKEERENKRQWEKSIGKTMKQFRKIDPKYKFLDG
jgi:ribosome biogenesis GTPase